VDETVAIKHRVTIVVLHHLKKSRRGEQDGDGEDILEMIRAVC
jgi:hypothetical protein